MFMTNQSCKRQKQSSASLWRRDGGQREEDQNEQQQQQSANHNSHNARIARCLTPISHPGAAPVLKRSGDDSYQSASKHGWRTFPCSAIKELVCSPLQRATLGKSGSKAAS